MGGGLAGLEPRDPTAGKRETEHTDSSHIKDFLGGKERWDAECASGDKG